MLISRRHTRDRGLRLHVAQKEELSTSVIQQGFASISSAVSKSEREWRRDIESNFFLRAKSLEVGVFWEARVHGVEHVFSRVSSEATVSIIFSCTRFEVIANR